MTPGDTSGGAGGEKFDAALLGTLARVTDRLDAVENAIRGIDETQEQLARDTSDKYVDVLDKLTAVRGDLSKVQEQVGDAEEAPVTLQRAPWWPDLNIVDAEVAWHALGRWVDEQLLPRQPRYAPDFRPCWRLHPDVVDELSALYAAWWDAYQRPRRDPTAAINFLDRWLGPAMRRIQESFEGCTRGRNSAHNPSTGIADVPQWDPTEVDAFLAEDLAGRPPKPKK